MTAKPVEAKVPVGLAPALTELGVSVADVLARAALPSSLFDGAGARLPIDSYFALWGAITAVGGDPSIGLRLVQMIRADHTEPLLLAAFSARDLASAAAAVVSYKRMLSPEDVTLTSDAGELCLSYAWPASVGEPPQVLVDIELAFLVEIARRARREIGLAPRRVAVRARALDPRAQHAAFFRCPIVPGAAANALYWDADDARIPFQTYNPGLLAALQPYLAAHTPAATSSTISQVRAVIAQQLRGRRPSVQSVSKDLAMSTRTLQRLLGEHGTSFRALLDEVRNQHAHGYLRATAFSDPEIAYLLGFDEPTSFYRAFRAWNGLSPSEFRRKAHPQ